VQGTRFKVQDTRHKMKKLELEFYRRKDVLKVARELLGKILLTNWKSIITSGRIVECEAYAGVIDKASHAAGGRRTARNEIMYGEGGYAYVYLCYGIHHLFNVVTNSIDEPHAILIRALDPIEGIEEMLLRTHKKKLDHTLTRGPGNVSKALGISTKHSGISLTGNKIFISDDGGRFNKKEIAASPRIGVDYAGKDALLPYRFYVKGNPFVSGRPK
jgi:DNA-3-methyladenine glycosylase